MSLTPLQYETLSRRINPSRIANRSQGGKQLSYLEAWDVKAHLIRVFGYCGFDSELIEYRHVTTRDYMSKGDPEKNKEPVAMVEVIYTATVRLTIKDTTGFMLATYIEAAGGSASGPLTMLGEHHDNALKTAESDALKRCAINLGNQFGLSLYDSGSTRDVIKGTLVKPDGMPEPEDEALTDEQVEAVARSLGATITTQNGTETPEGVSPEVTSDAPGEGSPSPAPTTEGVRQS